MLILLIRCGILGSILWIQWRSLDYLFHNIWDDLWDHIGSGHVAKRVHVTGSNRCWFWSSGTNLSSLLPPLRLLSASPIKGRHSGFSISIRSYLLHPPNSPMSFQPLPCPLSHSLHPYGCSEILHPYLLLGLPHFLFSIIIILHPIYSLSFSVHVHTSSVLPLVFFQTVPPALSLVCTLS